MASNVGDPTGPEALVKVVTSTLLSAPQVRGSLRALLRLLVVFVAAVVVFSVGFNALMALEGQQHSWWSSVYWTVVTMTTLGLGDITFASDLGRMYSVLVLLAGALLIVVLLPFTFIQYVYVPWRDALRRHSAPRSLSGDTVGHLVVTGLEPIEQALIERARDAAMGYVLLVDDLEEALVLADQGYRVMVGALDDPDTYLRARLDQAAMLVTARRDTLNTNVVFTAREVTTTCTVVATVASAESVDILELAGADRVLQLGPLLGRAFARRILAPRARSSEISRFEDLVIAEAAASDMGLAGQRLSRLRLRDEIGVSVVGVWQRGLLRTARPSMTVDEDAVLILAGTQEQLGTFDAWLSRHGETGETGGEDATPHVVILGGGRVGRAVAAELAQVGTSAVVIEQRRERHREELTYVHGDAADIDALRRAGIDEATAVVVTTHDDAMNVYLTLYCRRLRPHVQILGRVNLDRNVSSMYRAGADFVLSYASSGATEAWNEVHDDTTVLLAEGLVVFRVHTPSSLAGRRLDDTDISEESGCTLVGVARDGDWTTRIRPDDVLPDEGDQIALIGDEEGQREFLRRYVNAGHHPRRRRIRSRR